MRESEVKAGLEEAMAWEDRRRGGGEPIEESAYHQATRGALMKAANAAGMAAMKELIKANMETAGPDGNEVLGELRVAFHRALKAYYKA